MHGGLRYPTRWRRPYAEGCVRMAPKTLATLMRTRVRLFTACWHERRESRTRGLLAAPAFLPNTWRPTPVSPGCQGGALSLRAAELGDDSHFFLTGALALADPEGARTALSAATGRAEANALARHDIPWQMRV